MAMHDIAKDVTQDISTDITENASDNDTYTECPRIIGLS
jgi:hypothetical protein